VGKQKLHPFFMQASDTPPPRCTLLGGTFALLVQSGLAVAAIGTLIYKRSTERPRRPWVVWFFDASKQAFAGMLQHVVNLGFGVFFATTGHASECAWYITNFSISVLCGVVMLWGIMRVYTWAVARYRLTLLRSGEYGNPPSWRPWLAQMLIWGFLSCFEKLLTAIFVILPLHPVLDGAAAALEAPMVGHPALELVLVMVLAPVLLNAFFFWAMDNLIMRQRKGGSGRDRGGGGSELMEDDDDRPQSDDDELDVDDPSVRLLENGDAVGVGGSGGGSCFHTPVRQHTLSSCAERSTVYYSVESEIHTSQMKAV
jgi:hypothetical protein